MAAPLSTVKCGIRILCQTTRFARVSSTKFRKCSTVLNTYDPQRYVFEQTRPKIYMKRTHFSSFRKDRRCWKCDSPTDDDVELFFCRCGVVQSVPSDLTYFKAMNFEQSFDLDVSRLSKLYKLLQGKLHPDRYNQKSKEEQELAVQQSAFINKAYQTLLKPLRRGQYLLELHGDPIEESTSTLDPAFLMEIMEFNEDIAEASSNKDVLMELDNINMARIEKSVEDISKAFSDNDIPAAKAFLIKLKYFSNIDDKIKDIYRSFMEH